MKQLIASLNAAGLAPVVLGQQVVVLPLGGRVIGLYPTPDHNIFWTDPRLASPALFAPWRSSPGWLNLGGDRTWISPEIETNVGDPARLIETYQVPAGIDPAAYEIVESGEGSVTLATQMAVHFIRANVDLALRLKKRVSLLEKPQILDDDSLKFAGYRQETTLQALSDPPERVHPAIWNLLQVPGSGTILVPVRPGASVRAFIGQPVYSFQGDVLVTQVRTAQSFKFSLRASQSRGCLVYRFFRGQRGWLIVRWFAVHPEASYFDAPYDNPAERGHLTQVYVDNGGLGGFGELEYHSPALDPRANQPCVEDRSEVWSFCGSTEAIETLCQKVLRLVNTGSGNY